MNFLLTEGGTSGRRIITNSLYRCEHYNTHIPLIPHPHHLPLPPTLPSLPSPSFINTMRHIVLVRHNSRPDIIQRNGIINTTKRNIFLSKPIDKLLILWYNIIENNIILIKRRRCQMNVSKPQQNV